MSEMQEMGEKISSADVKYWYVESQFLWRALITKMDNFFINENFCRADFFEN